MQDDTAPLRGVPILVVEDDAASAKLISVLLAGEGARVHIVASAEDALRTLTTFPARVVVLDLVLPGMGGLLFVERLRQDPSTHDIVLLAVTAVNGPEAERLALEAGCSAYVRKPVDTETFVALVARCMGVQS